MKQLLTFILAALLMGANALTLNAQRADLNQQAGTHMRLTPMKFWEPGTKLPGRLTPRDAASILGARLPMVPRRASQLTEPVPGDLYGYLGQNFANIPAGLQEIQKDGTFFKLWNDPLSVGDEANAATLLCGWYNDKKVCGYMPVLVLGQIGAIKYVEYDFATGEVLREDGMNHDALFMTATLADYEGYIYGYGSTNRGTLAFMRTSIDNPTLITVIKECINGDQEACQSIAYNPVDRTLYGINLAGDFVKIDRAGMQTPIFSLASSVGSTDVMSGLAYSVIENVFYWNYVSVFGQSSFYTITPLEKKATLVSEYMSGEQFNFYFMCNEAYYADAPARATFRSSSFPKGATSGEVSFTLPTETNDGQAIPATTTLDWTISLDSKKYTSGKSAPGSVVKAQFTNLTEGVHTFALQSAIGEKTSISLPVAIYIGNDTPVAPGNVTLEKDGTVTWNAVTEGVSEGYIDLSKISYTVYLNGQEAAKTTATTAKITIPTEQPLTAFTATVTAECNGKTSDPGFSNIVVAGQPLKLDLVLTPTYEQAELFTTEDLSGDNTGWEFYPFDADGACFYSGYSLTNRMDDWLFLPATAFDEVNAVYSFQMQAHYMNINYPDEFIEVKIGKEPTADAMDILIMPTTRIVEPDYVTYGGTFRLPEAGTYYIGIHCQSAMAMFGVMIRDFHVTKTTISGSSPAGVTNAKAELVVEDKRQMGKVTFNLPTKSMDGKDLAANTEVSAIVEGVSSTTVKGAPGSEQSALVSVNDGITRISIRSAIGTNYGDMVWISLISGESIPEPVDNLKVTVGPSMKEATLTWLAPIQDVNCNTINPDNILYNIYYRDLKDQNWRAIENYLTTTSYTYTYSESDQMLVEFGVQAENEAGANNKISIVQTVLGDPYSVPMTETLLNTTGVKRGYIIDPGKYNDPYVTNWNVVQVSALPENKNLKGYGMMAVAEGAGQRGGLWLPAFSTANCNEASFNALLWTGGSNISIRYLAEGMTEAAELTYVERNNTWRNVSVNLPENAVGKGWVRLYILCEFDDEGSIFALKSYSVLPTTSIEAIGADSANAAIVAGAGYLEVKGATGAISVAATDGRVVAGRNATAEVERFNIEAGIYLVTVNGRTYKVIVR